MSATVRINANVRRLYNRMYQRLDVTLSPELLATCQQLVASIDNTPGPDGSSSSDPMVTRAKYYPILKGVLPWGWSNAMLMALSPGRTIQGHTDGYTFAQRYHIPLLSNDRCWVFHDETWERLEVGVLYTMDPTRLHGAVNWGETVRVHLIVDQ